MKARARSGLRAALAVLVWLCLGWLGPARAAAAGLPIPPAPARWVTDTAEFLSPAVQQALDARLESYQQATGHQVVVYIGRALGDSPIEQWSADTSSAWRLGRKGLDDGLALFVFTEERRLSIEVGYGLEDKVPDLRAAVILDEVLAPRLRAGERDTAITAGVDALLATIEGRPFVQKSPPPPRAAEEPLGVLGWVAIGAFVLAFGALFIWRPSLALWLLLSLFRSGRSSGGGGGFSGGGGRSGGGGARGSF